MNPYAKIAIKIAVVIVVCLVLLLAYNILLESKFQKMINRANTDRAIAEQIEQQLLSLLAYNDLLPNIRHVQYQDMQNIRNLIPEADEFVLTSYLRIIHAMIQLDHLDTDGISISGSPPATAGTSFEEAFTTDISEMQADLDQIVGALEMFRERKGEMNNPLVSFSFYEQMSTGAENFAVIAGGIESHAFGLTVRGSYTDIKKFTYDVFNMRPHTALVNFQMRPAGTGFGQTRQYVASFRLLTYGDANTPPPLWLAKQYEAMIAAGEEVAAEGDNGETDIEVEAEPAEAGV